MTKMAESQKRDFVTQVTTILDQNKQLLINEGYDPAVKIAQLKSKIAVALQKEAVQREAAAKAKNATKETNQATKEAYTEASATVELMAGLLGKDNSLVVEMRKLRKPKKAKKTAPADRQ